MAAIIYLGFTFGNRSELMQHGGTGDGAIRAHLHARKGPQHCLYYLYIFRPWSSLCPVDQDMDSQTVIAPLSLPAQNALVCQGVLHSHRSAGWRLFVFHEDHPFVSCPSQWLPHHLWRPMANQYLVIRGPKQNSPPKMIKLRKRTLRAPEDISTK
jgi:hypothetical protein